MTAESPTEATHRGNGSNTEVRSWVAPRNGKLYQLVRLGLSGLLI